MDPKDISILTPIQRFWRLLKPDKKEVQDVYVYAIFNGLVSLSLPLGIQAIVNILQAGQINSSWILLVSVVVFGVAVTGVLQINQLRITENLQQKIFTRAAFEFAFRIPRIKLEALYKHYAPELMNRFFDTVSVQKGLSKILIDFTAASLQVIFGLILLSFYHPFFIAFSLILVILVVVIIRLTAKKGLDTSLEESKYKYEVAHWLEEMARTSMTFKLAGKTDLPLKRSDTLVNKYLGARKSHFSVLVQQYSLMVVFKVLVATGLLAIGGILVMEQLMNIGQFVAAEIIILLVINSVEKLILSFETIYDILTSLEKIGMVTDLELEREGGYEVDPEKPGMQVEMKDVRFHYPDQKRNILDGLDLTLKPGEKVMITGENGSGKSTLLHILAGLYEVHQGSILYDGISLTNIHLDSLRMVIGDSLSQELLFEGSILENITVDRDNADVVSCRWAIDNIGLSDYINSLENGIDTILDPQGKKLPRSIIQKLLLARGIADKPRLLLLEDAFEHSDEHDRKRLIDFITSPENQWTMVVVSNDTYLAEKVDKVIVMEKGKVISENKKVELTDA